MEDTPRRPGPFMGLIHFLHLVSSATVMALAMLLSTHFKHAGAFERRFKGHSRFWTILGAIDLVIMLPVMILSFFKPPKKYLAFVTSMLAVVWLAASIIALDDYTDKLGGRPYGSCDHMATVFGVSRKYIKCGLKKTLIAFASIAFICSLLATLLHAKSWAAKRTVSDKQAPPAPPQPTA